MQWDMQNNTLCSSDEQRVQMVFKQPNGDVVKQLTTIIMTFSCVTRLLQVKHSTSEDQAK